MAGDYETRLLIQVLIDPGRLPEWFVDQETGEPDIDSIAQHTTVSVEGCGETQALRVQQAQWIRP